MRNLLLIAILTASLHATDLFAQRKYAPMPDRVLAAKSVYLDDQTGYPGVADKAYQELVKWGRFKVVTDRKDADLILLLSTRAYTGGYIVNSSGQVSSTGSGVYGHTSSVGVPLLAVFGYVTFIDPSNGEAVWGFVKRARWGARHSVHIIIDELRKRMAEQESKSVTK